MSTASLRLTEPYVLLIGATEHERALARRRRREAGTPRQTPGNSPPNSRPPSPPPGISAIVEGNFVAPFIPPSSRGGAGARGMSPVPLLASGGSRSASRSRAMEGTTTGTGTTAEADAADEPPPAMLRGLLTITLAKPSRIRSINVRLRGVSRTDWPEGIGPRRLDVLEETQLFSKSFNFFTASTNPPSERRAASIGPGIREQTDLDGRGRTGARRATSMMPTRELSIGLVYPSRDSRIHEGESDEVHNTIDESEESVFPRSTLSRITSSTQLDVMDDSPPPVQPWEASPAYDDGNSPSSSPTAGPSNHLNRVSSVDSFRSNSPHSDRFATSPRSPLNPLSFIDRQTASPAPTSPETTLTESGIDESARTRPESGLTLSTIPTTTDSIVSTDTQANGWTGAPTSESTESRGRPPNRVTNGGASATASSSTALPHPLEAQRPSPPIESMRSAASPSPAPSSSHHRDPSLGGSIGPGSIRGMKAPPAARSASSRPSRFSLGALGDALRGKSMSRAREAREASTQRESGESRGRGRAESPDSSRRGDRDQSRGRKTALKVLRDALTSGVDGEEGESDDDEGRSTTKSWREFRAGTYTYPISIPVPASLPPTISSDFGAVSYFLKATVNRAGALTSNLTSTTEVTLVSCPGSDDTEESESIVVERFWESQMRYHIALSGKSFPIGGKIPICIRLNPLAKIRLYRITAVLEQRTNYYASNKRLTRHETPKKFSLLKIEHPESPQGKGVKREALLPIFSDEVDAISVHPLRDWFINPTSSDDSTPSCLDPIGPWNLESTIQLPDCAEKLTFTTAHDRANITVSHILKIMLRVERGDDDFLDSKGKRKLWDVIIETPIHILSCRCAQTALPAYTAANGSTTVAPSLFAQRPCTFNHTTPISRSNAQQNGVVPISPEVATVEQTMLFARLVAGEVTAAGEIPPSYTAVAIPDSSASRSGRSMERSSSSSSSIMTARGRTSSRGGGSSGIGGSSPGPSTSRGRSGSVDVVVTNGGGARSRRSLSIVSGLTR